MTARPPVDERAAVVRAAEIEPLLLTVEQAAALLGISPRHFQSIDSNGRLGPLPVKLGAAKRYRLDELRRWCTAGCPPRTKWVTLTEAGP